MPDRSATVPRILLGIFALLVIAFQARLSWDLFDYQLHIDQRARPPFFVGARGEINGLEDEAEAAGLKPRDRLKAVNGSPAPGTVAHQEAVKGRKPGDVIDITVETPVGLRTTPVKLAADRPLTVRAWVLATFLQYLTPWFCLALGFTVVFLRPRDSLAWLLLGLLLSFASVAEADGGTSILYSWGSLARSLGVGFLFFLNRSWGLWMMLFGQYFPDRTAPTWMNRMAQVFVGIPILLIALVTAFYNVRGMEDANAIDGLQRFLNSLGPIPMILGMLGISTFFINISIKQTFAKGDSQRRLRLLFWGTSVALTPLFLLVLTALIFRRPIDSVPPAILLPSLVALFLFPLTLAYVIVVEKALELRVAIRQGLQYTLAKGGVRVIQVGITAIILVVAISMASNPTLRRPQQMQFLAFGLMGVLLLRRVAQKVLVIVDRRFFREAINLERVLGELSEKVRGIVETGPLLETVTGSISSALHVPRVTALLPSNGHFAPVLSTGDSSTPAVRIARSGALAEQLGKSREPLRVSFVNPEPWVEKEREPLEKLSTELLLPLAVKDRLLGFLSLGPKKSEEPYSATDVRLLQSVASQTGLALENSRLTEAVANEVAQRERLNRELEIAREVQERLFPQSGPKIDSLDYAGACRPASSVGGDYYDFVSTCDGRLGIAIGDISGKGIPAALLMASLQASLRGLAISNPPAIATLMTNLNRLVYDASPSNRYATFFYGVYDPKSRQFLYVNGGHNPPMVFRGDQILRLEEGGPVIGLFGPAQYTQAAIELQSGDVMVMFTDGVSEAENHGADEFGEDRMMTAVRAKSDLCAREMIAHLMQETDAFVAGAPQHDDMTLVVVRVQ